MKTLFKNSIFRFFLTFSLLIVAIHARAQITNSIMPDSTKASSCEKLYNYTPEAKNGALMSSLFEMTTVLNIRPLVIGCVILDARLATEKDITNAKMDYMRGAKVIIDSDGSPTGIFNVNRIVHTLNKNEIDLTRDASIAHVMQLRKGGPSESASFRKSIESWGEGISAISRTAMPASSGMRLSGVENPVNETMWLSNPQSDLAGARPLSSAQFTGCDMHYRIKLKAYDMDVMWDQIKYDITQENFNFNTYVNSKLIRYGSEPYVKNSKIHAINNALDRSIYIYIPDRTKNCSAWSTAMLLHSKFGFSLPKWTAIPLALAAGGATRISIGIIGGYILPMDPYLIALTATCLGGATGGLVYDAIAKPKINHSQAVSAGVGCVINAIGEPLLKLALDGLAYIAEAVAVNIAQRWVAGLAPQIENTITGVMTEMINMAMKKVLPS
jgi:hypothetical protein